MHRIDGHTDVQPGPMRWLAAMLIAAGLVGVARAETLPTRGTFRGTYTVNRAGVARLLFMIIPKELQPRLAKFEGKYVEIEVLQGRQPANPGPVIVEKIGKTRVIGPPALAAEVVPLAPGIGGAKTFDLLFRIKNMSRKGIELNAGDVTVAIEGYRSVDNPDLVDPAFGAGYTNYQLRFGGDAHQPWGFLSPKTLGKHSYYTAGRIFLPPGASAPFVWHGLRQQRGKYEVVVTAALRPEAKVVIPFESRTHLDLPVAPAKARPSPVTVDATVTREGEWVIVQGRLKAPKDQSRRILVRNSKGPVFLPGLVQSYDAKGKAMPFELNWPDPPGPWVQKVVDEKGLPLRIAIRHWKHFCSRPAGRIEMWTVTDAGPARLTLAARLPPVPDWANPPWGNPLAGCRARIRLEQTRYARGEPIKLFFQIDSDRRQSDALWIPKGGLAKRLQVYVNDKEAMITSCSLAEGKEHAFPIEGHITLKGNWTLFAKEHPLYLVVQGEPATAAVRPPARPPAKGAPRPLRRFRGAIASNEVLFEVYQQRRIEFD